MVTINCDVYEKRDFEILLDYAKQKKIEDCSNKKITPDLLEIELEKIAILKRVLKGKNKDDYQRTRN